MWLCSPCEPRTLIWRPHFSPGFWSRKIENSFNPPSLVPLVTELCLLLSFFCFSDWLLSLDILSSWQHMETEKDDGEIYLILTLLWIAQQLFVTLAIYLLTGPPFSNYFKSSSRVTWLTSLLFIMLLLNCCHDNSTAKT